MKIKMIVILLISSCLVPIKLYALENPCAGAVPISVTAGLGGVTSSIQTILNHYRDYVHDGNYRLCFPSTEFETVGTLHIPNDSGQEVLIAGLNVTAKATFSSSEHSLLNLDGEQITLYDSAIACTRSDQIGIAISAPNNTVQGTDVSNCSEGIRIEASNVLLDGNDIHDSNTCVNSSGAGTTIREGDIHNCATEAIRIAAANAVIENSEVYNSPMCVDILGNGAIVKGNNIRNCSTEAVRIAASNTLLGPTDAAMYDEEKNTLTGNTIGIHQVSGAGNRWPYNSICGGNGIVVDGGVRPTLHVGEGSVVNLQCERSGEITNRCRLQFDSVPEVTGEVEIYGTEAAGCDLQGRDYIAKCTLNSDNSCIFDASESTAALSHIECGPRKCRFTAFFTGTSSSMYVSEPFVLNISPWSTVIIADVPGPMDNPSARDPGHSNSGDDSGDLSNDGSDRLALNDPAFDPTATDDTEDRGAGATAADGGPASAARCTMIPSALFNPQHAAVSFIFLALPALFIAALRQKNRRKFS